MNSSVPSPASPRENTVSFYNGKENVASTVRRRSLAAEVQPTMNLKAATYGDNLKITVCLISSFTNSCSGNRNWYSATWGLSIRLPSRSWKYRNASLGVLMDCKKTQNHITHLHSLSYTVLKPTSPRLCGEQLLLWEQEHTVTTQSH